jgi:outer membrane protein assembly factor BamD
MNKRWLTVCGLAALLAGSLCAGAYGHQKVKVFKTKPAKKDAKKADATAQSAEPDKILYERAVYDVKHSKYTEARLSFQTLINTYPDSEYLAKAKLGVADSYYKEGGTSNLTQAVDEYKNFIVFFPFLDEAAYAQMQVGMSHYRMMGKSDRDSSQAEAAEDEFQAFLLKYPQNPLVPKAEQYLRNVQEVLADGYYRVARFYYLKGDYRASAARLVDLTQRYPLYSQSDEALSMLGDVYMRAKQASKNEDDKNHWADLAAECYSRIVKDYPLSDEVSDAKERLKSLGVAVPAADPEALARMKTQQMYEKHHHEFFVLKLPLGMIESRPDVSQAARSGEPNLNPPNDLVSATDVLKQGAAGPDFRVAAEKADASDTSAAGGANDSGGTVVEGGASESTGGEAPTTSVGAEIIGTGTNPAPAPTSTEAPASAPAAENAPAASDPPAASMLSTVPGTGPATSITSQPNSAPQATQANGTASATSSTSKAKAAEPVAPKADSKTESTSKKKKGIKKLVPW